MWHKIITPLTLVALLVAGAAQSALERIEEAYEIDLASVSMPTHDRGQVLFVPCVDCDRVALRVDETTRYLLGASSSGLTLKEFRETAAGVSNPRDALVYVLYSTKTRLVTQLILDVPSQ